jgi:zinc transport system ATP-binding protein
MKILSVKNLSVTLDDVPILRNLTFDLEEGEVLAIIGPNAAGKTVLIKTLLGHFPYQGEIAWQEGARFGYVPQKIDADRHLPVNFSNLFAAKAELLGLTEEDIASTVETLDLPKELLATPVGHLSGGHLQRALIAFAILGKPNVLIFDEPTASIDVGGEEAVYHLLHRLQDRYGLTIMLVSHDLSVVYQYATRVLCLGQAASCFGPPQEVLTPANLEKVYGAPHKYYHHLHKNELPRHEH